MPKERRNRSVSSDRSRASPFPCSSNCSRQSLPKNPSYSEENVKEWEEARCPVCIEHPHNAILLMCSSHKKGCRPYMCDTSYRHSNCFDQFRKSFTDTPSTNQESTPLSLDNSTSDAISEPTTTNLQVGTSEEGSKVIPKLVCPLCRGKVNGWVIVESARHFMDIKSRSCASEACHFSGTYKDLRKHARLEHPSVRPSEADPERQRNWRRLEQQRDLGDLISTLQSSIGEERSEEEDSILSFDEGGWLTVFLLIRVFQPGSSLSRSSSWSGTSRARAQVTVRRRSTRLWGETHDGENGSVSRNDDNENSDGGSGSRRRRVRRRTTPDIEP